MREEHAQGWILCDRESARDSPAWNDCLLEPVLQSKTDSKSCEVIGRAIGVCNDLVDPIAGMAASFRCTLLEDEEPLVLQVMVVFFRDALSLRRLERV